MNPPSADRLALLDTLLQQLGLELAFVDAARDDGSDVLCEQLRLFTEALGADAPEQIRQAVAAAGVWLDDLARVDGRFTEGSIAALNAWHPWLVTALADWASGRPCALPPADWVAAADRGAPASRVAATPTAPVSAPPNPAPIEDQLVEVSAKAADAELMQLFCAEAQDLLRDIEQGVLVLETNPRDEPTINMLFRAFHTFKGNVGVMNLLVLQQLTHELESLLDAARRGHYDLGRESFDVILAGQDTLARYVEELSRLLAGGGEAATIPLPIPRLIATVRSLLAHGPQPAPAPVRGSSPAPAASTPVLATVPPPPTPSPSAETPPPAPSASASAAPASASAAATPPQGPPPAAPPRAAPAPAPEPAAPPATRSAVPTSAGVVRVDTMKLDSLIDLVGELVIAQSMVVQHTEASLLSDSDVSRRINQLRGITSELQRTAMSLRMVPIRGTFQKMTRLVRDLAMQQGKDIRLVLQGEDTELDRTLVEELNDPLIHMIRNSADHGLEPADIRAAAGKPRTGRITLRAFHQGGFVVIQISDDGRGLSPAKIRTKAIERGIIKPSDSLDEREIFDLIFAPGFSTAETVTDLSGRGVGMDVVRRNLEKIRGKIEIDSVEGQGTTFTLYVPLTLAIIEGLLVGVGGQRYVIPTLSVRESFRPLPGSVTTVHGHGEVVRVRGRLTPILRLGRHLNTPHAAIDPTQGIVVVVEAGQACRCLLVDELIGKQEVVIKSLGDMFHHQTDFAGAAILGDGRVGLILDVNALVKLKPKNGDAAAGAGPPHPAIRERHP